MIFIKYLLLTVIIFFTFYLNSYAQIDTTYYPDEEYLDLEGTRMRTDEYTVKKIELISRLVDIEKSIDTLKIVKRNYDSAYRNLQSEIYALIDTDSSRVKEFSDRFDATEKKILLEAATLTDIKEYWFEWITNNKIRLLKEYRTRYAIMKEKIDHYTK
ncbi:MAG: hypothetical protein NTU73_08735 [Ignavibacteriae bacterium]|nr:hypothetical protein [Ignavibacteriota bacterium]